MKTFFFEASNGSCQIQVRKWVPDNVEQINGVIQIAHGMSEHTARYDDLAKYLNGLGYVVYANDHMGHGGSINGKGEKGYFDDRDGWSCLVNDMRILRKLAGEEYPKVERWILYGHSMGSFLARSYAVRYPKDFDAYIFSGTAGKNPALPIAKLIIKAEIKKRGLHGKSALVYKLAFGAYCKRIKPVRTSSDWLTTQNEVVDAYKSDKLCGFMFTCAAMRDLFNGLSEISNHSWARNVENVPMYIFAGKEDPVGNYGKGVEEVCNRLKKEGKTKVVMQLYRDGRHEMHNESNKDEVYRGIGAFLRSLS